MQIRIPTPCHERWQDMNPTERGAFCLACQTEVQDFTKMSDAEIRQYFQKTAGKTCGRFRADQLDRPIALEPKRGFSFGKFWLGLGLFLGWVGKAEAQEKPTIQIEAQTTKKQENSPPKAQTIRGKILDEKGAPLAGVNVFIKKTSSEKFLTGTTSNEKGLFELSFELPPNTPLVLEATLLGFDRHEIPLDLEKPEPLAIKMKEEKIIMGMLIPYNPKDAPKELKLKSKPIKETEEIKTPRFPK